MKKKTVKATAKKPKKIKKVKQVGWDGDTCEYCLKRTDTLMQVSDGGYVCECCLEEAEREIRDREEPSYFRNIW